VKKRGALSVKIRGILGMSQKFKDKTFNP
jgi:hypothetical protein